MVVFGAPLIKALTGQVPTARLNRYFIPRDEYIADTLAVGTFFVTVIPSCLTKCTFIPIRYFFSNRVSAVAALFAVDFGTATVCDCQVVASAATL